MYSTNHHTVEQKTIWGEAARTYCPLVCCAIHHGFEQETNGEKQTQPTVVYTKDSNIHTCVLCPKQRAPLNAYALSYYTLYNSPVPHTFNFGSKYFNVAIITRLPVCWRKCPFDHFSEWGFSSSEMFIDHIDWTIILVYQNFRPACGGPSIILLNNHFSVSKFSPQKAENDHSCERSF